MDVVRLCQEGKATMPQLLRHWAAADPQRLAFREKHFGIWKRITWGEYWTNVKRFALGLRTLGFERGDRLAVASENTPEWMYADLAAQALGGACLGVYPTNPWSELRYIVRHSRSKIVVCGDQEQTDKVLEAMAQQGGLPDLHRIVCVDTKGMREYPRDRLMSFADVLELGAREEAAAGDAIEQSIASAAPDEVAIVVYTSGTTGMPKGALLTHRNMLHSASAVVDKLGLSAETYSVVCYLPLCHVAERSFSTVMQLVCGSVVNFAESVDTVAGNLREIAPLGFLGVPRIWEKLQQNVLIRAKDATPFQQRVFETCLRLGRPIADRAIATGGERTTLHDKLVFAALWLVCFRSLQRYLGLDRARNCFCGGATVSPEVLRFFRTLGVPVYQIYGMTEAAGVTHMQQPGYTQAGSTGLAISGLEERVAGDGELLLRGPSVFKGYLFDAEATARALHVGWLHTGDVVEYAPGGELRVVDRKKEIIITSGGKNITPSLIENALRDSLYIREAILVGEGRHFLSALIQVDYDTVGKWAQERKIPYTTYRSLAERQEVRQLIEREIDRVNERFARVESVRKFVILTKQLDHDDGELTATMKVRRRVIETRFRDEIASIYGTAA
jgi:long-chain acyl-CoA synthetase